MEPVKRPHSLPPDPFVPEEDVLHNEMDALYDAIYNVRLHHHWGQKTPKKSFNAACSQAIDILQAMKVKA